MISFKEFIESTENINEGAINAVNISSKIERLAAFEQKMFNREPFIMEDGTELVFPLTKHNLDEIERLKNHKLRATYKFEDINGALHALSKFTKTKEFGSNKSLNSQGQALADAGERATILSFTKDLLTPEDTEELLFIENPNAFERWKNSFIQTKLGIESIIGKGFEKKYLMLHDATDTSNFNSIISKFTTKIKTNKDSWNPADTWLIMKSKQKEVQETLYKIVNEAEGNNLINRFNSAIYRLFKKKYLVPVSLKQVTSKSYNLDYNNTPGEEIPNYDVKISKFICNLKMDTVEIGSFNFINQATGAKITFQTKGYPHSSDSTQTEITSDGSDTGGRLGKVPAYIIKKVYDDNKFFKISPSKYFEKDLSKTNNKQIKEWVHWYNVIDNHNASETKIDASKIEDHIRKVIKNLDKQNTKTFKHKIQGLAMQYFLIKNERDISSILTKYILGAKKINPDSGFFIKIY